MMLNNKRVLSTSHVTPEDIQDLLCEFCGDFSSEWFVPEVMSFILPETPVKHNDILYCFTTAGRIWFTHPLLRTSQKRLRGEIMVDEFYEKKRQVKKIQNHL